MRHARKKGQSRCGLFAFEQVLVQRVTAGLCEIADGYRIGVFGCCCSVRSPRWVANLFHIVLRT
jgi:hypothetical protein